MISPKALARVDLDRPRLSAEVYNNWIPKTQGAMTIRPGTKWFGSSYNDTGAEFVEFVASTNDVALCELTHEKMRIWLGDDAHELALLSRPPVDTTLTITDTGWSNTSTGGALATSSGDLIPTMTTYTGPGVVGISATSENSTESGTGQNRNAWKAVDDDPSTYWQDTGVSEASSLPTVWQITFSQDQAVVAYAIRAGALSGDLNNAPVRWSFHRILDTGTGSVVEDTQGSETAWSVGERRTYNLPGADTGTVPPSKTWGFTFQQTDGDTELKVNEIELFSSAAAQQVKVQGGACILNATSIGALARREKRVMVSDTGTEHSLAITIDRGPVTLRVGSTQRDDDYIAETSLGTGYHNLAFTPNGASFWVTLQTDDIVNRIVGSCSIGDSGTVEITAPWSAANIEDIRYDQSADVVYVDCRDVQSSKIERRGTGRSWSIVDYAPNDGPFLQTASSSAKLSVSHFAGNTTLNSDIPFFTPEHVGALIRIFHQGQGGQWWLGAEDAATDVIKVTGISDTGTATATSERRIVFSVTGTWAGRITIERSIDGEDIGFKPISGNLGAASDTGTFTRTIDDPDDNVSAWYRARIADTGASGSAYTSGTAIVNVTYGGGGKTGIARITGYNTNTSVAIEVLSNFSDTGPSDNWQQGYWSDKRGFPSAVALHGGRLGHAQGGSTFLSVSDDFESFSDDVEGDAGPIIRTLGSGPVDTIHFLASLLRLVVGTSGAEISIRSSSLDEPLTPSNSAASTFSTQGSANLRPVKIDNRVIFVQRSGQRVLMVGGNQNAFGEYESSDLTTLVPDLLRTGVVSVAIQRQPDTRLHAVLADGTVAILTYEPSEEVVCWTTWQSDTGTSPTVEKAMCLPGQNEDAVYYHIRRVINGSTKRYLEKWAKETECVGDTGLTWLMDCARSYTDTGRATALTDIGAHLVGESVVVWSDDTGSIPGVDRSPDVGGVQTRYTVDTGGDVTLSVPVHHAVAGLPYKADWKSGKLAYAAEAGTALAQMKRTDKIAFVLYQTHNNGLFFGNDTGKLDPLPRVLDAGATVDADKIFQTLDKAAMPFPGLWNEDSRIHLRAKSPRPATVLAAIPTVQTNDKV